MFLTADRIKVSYGGVKALQGISLNVQEHEILCILGGNGAGKTTLVNAICGFALVHSGRITFRGENIIGLPPHTIVKLGIVQVPEGRGILGPLSVWENLRIGAYLEKSDGKVKESMEKIFAIFPVLKERRKQSGGSLSGGEQQMLAIGRALMAGPKLLLMDEPTLGLSPLMRLEVIRVTQKINEDGTSIILVEQNASMALRIAHNGIVIQNGQIALKGSSEELSNNPFLRESYLS